MAFFVFDMRNILLIKNIRTSHQKQANMTLQIIQFCEEIHQSTTSNLIFWTSVPLGFSVWMRVAEDFFRFAQKSKFEVKISAVFLILYEKERVKTTAFKEQKKQRGIKSRERCVEGKLIYLKGFTAWSSFVFAIFRFETFLSTLVLMLCVSRGF